MYRFLAVLTILFGVSVATPIQAADPAPDQKGVSAQNLENLVQTLENPDRRDALLDDLRTLLEAKREAQPPQAETGAGAALLANLSERVGAVSKQLVAAASVLVDLPRMAGTIVDGLENTEQRNLWLEMLARIVVVLLAGFAAAFLLRRALQRPRDAIESRAEDDVSLTIVLLLTRTLLDLLPIAGFAAASFGALTVIGPDGDGRIATVALIDANVIVGAVLALSRMFLAPVIAGLRLFPLENETANYIFIWIKRLTILSVYGYFIIQAAMLLGLPLPAYNALLKLLGLAVGLLLIMIALQNRQNVAECIRGDGGGPLPVLRRRFADIWHILFIIYLLCSFASWALEINGGFEFVAQANCPDNRHHRRRQDSGTGDPQWRTARLYPWPGNEHPAARAGSPRQPLPANRTDGGTQRALPVRIPGGSSGLGTGRLFLGRLTVRPCGHRTRRYRGAGGGCRHRPYGKPSAR